jgi:hypothetical protein
MENENGNVLKEVEEIKVYLDDDVPEDMDGIIRVGSVILEFEDGRSEYCNEIVDNQDFNTMESYSDAIEEMKEYVINALMNHVNSEEIDLDSISIDKISIEE